MNNPLDPSSNPSFPRDPMLDALEQSIENPPDFHDPWAGSEGHIQDKLCGRLDALESYIENVSPDHPVPPVPDPYFDIYEANIPTEANSVPLDLTESTDDMALFEPEIEKLGSFDSSPPIPPEGLSRMLPPHPSNLPVPRKGGGGRPRTSLPRSRFILPRMKGRVSRPINSERYCPESHEKIHEQQCENCQKYRQWPEGTQEEPRQCWYDWQVIQSTIRALDEEQDNEE